MSSAKWCSVLICTCLAFVFLSLCLVSQPTAASAGTNRHIREIFIGQCWYYTEYIGQSLSENVQKNCTDLWEKFSHAWMYKDPCNVTVADYEPFVNAATVPGEVPTNKAVFWEAAYTLAHDYSGRRRRYVASADILTGYLGNHVFSWCGQEEEPGINYDHCPLEEDCPMFQGQYGGMWTAVSKAVRAFGFSYRKTSLFF
ncbi:ADP-ribosyl cyclase/cyclic ADP-ribose hydrolase-like [Lingula anatina]|uniref:ADP-ribosyl cyclase/cyclic ADP-ribose hydrolase-like n=1 Tax=Lingula anatina TaxID=7574 RepID=A0A1S3HG46_LINAN|nr:ADP-ribosyl cyclase/cyclic ADP-ribose hydrolase-like [Lingula anatina]|eukprot:XP_013385053.1 ADP-ribosyl cyclase/cyclic ADP-ribose hydrolase-like [Lingula anatina]